MSRLFWKKTIWALLHRLPNTFNPSQNDPFVENMMVKQCPSSEAPRHVASWLCLMLRFYLAPCRWGSIPQRGWRGSDSPLGDKWSGHRPLALQCTDKSCRAWETRRPGWTWSGPGTHTGPAYLKAKGNHSSQLKNMSMSAGQVHCWHSPLLGKYQCRFRCQEPQTLKPVFLGATARVKHGRACHSLLHQRQQTPLP